MLRMLTSISVTARTHRGRLEGPGARVGSRGVLELDKKCFQGHLHSGSGSPKPLLAAPCWLPAAAPRADDELPTFCQGGGCNPSTSQPKQTWGAGRHSPPNSRGWRRVPPPHMDPTAGLQDVRSEQGDSNHFRAWGHPPSIQQWGGIETPWEM